MYDEITIVTNNVPRDVIEAWMMNGEDMAKFKKEFDYINWDAVETGEYNVHFVKYKGEMYDLNDAEAPASFPAAHPFNQWSGYYSESFFSGILFKYVNNFEQVIMGRYYT